jgi:oligopeptide transport system ATP-binding protein
MSSILEVEELDIRFATPEGDVSAINSVSLTIEEGETLGVVGESGSGKTQLFLNELRGSKISMIFQDPMTSLNPYLKVSRQMTEGLVEHAGVSEAEARRRGVVMLERVGIPEAAKRLDMYPHEFSGGMRQRAMIAIALMCGPELLIADEPTTALDVTIQAQILDLLATLRRDINGAVVMISHDLGVVAGLCDRVMVMYAGRVVETGTVRDIFHDPQHPYTQGLVHSMPRLDEAKAELLATIPGQPPNLQSLPPGCAFQDRCRHAIDRCRMEIPLPRDLGGGRSKSCHLEVAP